jgi:hypothetical protein
MRNNQSHTVDVALLVSSYNYQTDQVAKVAIACGGAVPTLLRTAIFSGEGDRKNADE